MQFGIIKIGRYNFELKKTNIKIMYSSDEKPLNEALDFKLNETKDIVRQIS